MRLCFLALIILMGNVRKPTMKSYCTTNAMHATPSFGTIMSRNRFFVIDKFLHFAHNSAVENGDRLGKIRPVIEDLRGIFQSAFIPRQYVAVDESLLL